MSNFKFKKKYGQNFLQNKEVIKKIVRVSSIKFNSLIIEVGPGSGNLTCEIANMCRDSNILCYEIDLSLKEILLERIKEYNNIKVLFTDFLKSNIVNDIKSYSYDYLYFVSNVPYYITTPIIFKLIESGLKFEKIVMMVQKEMGDRLCSSPSSRDYGAISVILSYWFDLKKEFIVDRNQFYPKPNVDSVVISFKRKENILELFDLDLFVNLVHDSFQYKRKTIRNNLKKYDLGIVSEVLNSYGYDLSVRAEALDYRVFVDLANAIFKGNN